MRILCGRRDLRTHLPFVDPRRSTVRSLRAEDPSPTFWDPVGGVSSRGWGTSSPVKGEPRQGRRWSVEAMDRRTTK